MNTPGLVYDLNEVDSSSSLSARQKEFCLQFALCGVAAKAAREAGYTGRDKSAALIGWRLLKRDDVQAYIAELRAESRRLRNVPSPAKLAETHEQLENQVAVSLAGFFDMSDGVIRLRDPADLTDWTRQQVKELVFDEDGRFVGYRVDENGMPMLQRMLELGLADE